MYRLLFKFAPWWIFAVFAILFGSMVVPFYGEYRAAQTEVFYAQNEGPPAVVDIERFNGNRDVGYFDEVHINAQILANLGILRLRGEGGDFDSIVLGNENGLPLAVLMFESASSERNINQLVNTASIDNRVSVQGFLTSTRRTDVEREITRQGYSGRNLLVIEPYFENRAGILEEKVQDAQLTFFIVVGITALFALIAIWRFRRWRKRRAAKKSRRTSKAQQPMPAGLPTSRPAPVSSEGASAPSSNPWGGTQKPKLAQQPARPAPPAPDPVLEEEHALIPAFQSVFPHGGSSFKFKTADQIVRQYFGSTTKIGSSNADS